MPDPAPVTRILLADDHPVVLGGLKALIGAQPDFAIVAACADGRTALDLIRTCTPDIAILDHAMPYMTGLEVLAALEASGVPCRVVLLTASLTDPQLVQLASHEVSGVLLKETAADLLLDCLRAVAAGQRWFAPDLIEHAQVREGQRGPPRLDLSKLLTPREQQLVGLVAEGLSNKSIARELGLSPGTVKIHLHNVYQKLSLDNRTALAALALRR